MFRAMIFGAIQIYAFYRLYLFLKESIFVFEFGLSIALIILYIYIYNYEKNSVYKILWISMLAIAPFFTILLYLGQYSDILSKKFRRNMKRVTLLEKEVMTSNEEVFKKISEVDKDLLSISAFLNKGDNYPPYINKKTKYFSCGKKMFDELLYRIENAKDFIFLEYYIIEEGEIFGDIFELLKKKAKDGVDVRIIYDELGSLGRDEDLFRDNLRREWIKVEVFNPLSHYASISLNHRDHRKIAVIDGKYGFLGGINIGDEYVNIISPYGHWKDTAIMLEGDAVWSLTVMFLSMWSVLSKTDEDFNRFKVDFADFSDDINLGVVQPYFNNSIYNQSISENLYIQIISKAKESVYITTPYLVLTDELSRVIENAALSNIRVVIITPNKQDKKMLRMVNQSYYEKLISAGVEIYEYLPGFIHAKMLLVDGKYATIGGVNFDYRSFYLNMESGCFMYKTPELIDIKNDIDYIVSKSRLITVRDMEKRSFFKRIMQSVLKVFAPLM